MEPVYCLSLEAFVGVDVNDLAFFRLKFYLLLPFPRPEDPVELTLPRHHC